jgi:aldose sugar dehydrogenase
MRISFFLTICFLIFSCENAGNQNVDTERVSEDFKFEKEILAEGLTNPWGLEFLPDGKILIAERPGRLRIYENGRLNPNPVKGLPEIWAHGQGGLLDVKMHPNYDQNGWLYLAYAAKGNGNSGNLAISRARLEGNQLTDVEKIFHGEPHTSGRAHFGTRLLFDDDGYLFFAIGDRGQPNFAQKLDNHNGKVLRIYDDGSVPEDNPFVDDPNALPEVWAYGSRNIQGMQFHPDTRELWTHEHGPKGGDEINIIRPGENYGWPKATHGVNYNGTVISEHKSLPGKVDPIKVWTPSIAPCGMDFVTSDKYPGWENNILIGALAGQHIHRVEIDGEKVVNTEKLLEGFARFRAIRQGPNGYIYVLTESPGLFLRLIPEE